MDATFPGSVLNWAYPKFTLPAKVDPAVYSGLLIRARIFKAAGNVAIIAFSGDQLPRFWVPDLFPPDGEWHVVFVPFVAFNPGPNNEGNQNARLDPAAWKEIGVGMMSKVPDNAIEVSDLVLVGGDGD